MLEKNTALRERWIDCAKALAILAVAVDHCSHILYENVWISFASFFSVSVFFFLAGVTEYLSTVGKQISYAARLKRIGKTIILYAVATGVVEIFYTHYLILSDYLDHLLHFSIQGPFYFLPIYFQFVLIAPLLKAWCDYCSARRAACLWHAVTVILLGVFSYTSVRFTFFLPLHGGARFLLGGTYIVLYYLGMAFVSAGVFEKAKRYRRIILPVSAAAWIGILLWLKQGAFPLDKLFPNWTERMNPPGLQLILFAISTVFLSYSTFSMIDDSRFRNVLRPLSFMGQYTIYTFLYHYVIMELLLNLLWPVTFKTWGLCILVFPAMVLLPPLIAFGLKRLFHRIPASRIVVLLAAAAFLPLAANALNTADLTTLKQRVPENYRVVGETAGFDSIEIQDTQGALAVIDMGSLQSGTPIQLSKDAFYEISFDLDCGENVPQLLYFDFFGTGYDDTKQDFTYEYLPGRSHYSKVCASGQVAADAMIRLIYITDQPYELENFRILVVEAQR